MTQLAQPELLSVRQVATILGLGVSTVWRGVAKGTFPEPIKICGSTRWRRSDIDALIAAEAA